MNQSFVIPKTIGLFPIPLSRIEAALPLNEVEAAKSYISSTNLQPNAKSPYLFHTKIFSNELPEIFEKIKALLTPQITIFGGILFGQQLQWNITGIWGNVSKVGGYQPRHNHANSIVSGIIYLTQEDKSTCTRFHKSPGGTDFSFENHNDDVDYNIYNATTWSPSSVNPGDVILFPSYLMHEVPKITDHDRLTIAFNAVPNQLNCSGYIVNFK